MIGKEDRSIGKGEQRRERRGDGVTARTLSPVHRILSEWDRCSVESTSKSTAKHLFCSTAETSKPNVLFLTPLILSCHMVKKILWCWVGSISRPLLLRKQFKADSTLSEVNQMYYHRTIRKIIRALNCGCNCMAICAVINKL